MDDPASWLWIWLLGALFFALGEMSTPGTFFLLPFALGSLAAAVVAALDVNLVAEWAVFVGVSIATVLAFRPLARRLDRAGHDDGIGARRLLGQDATVLADIPGAGHVGLGMVLIGREEWRAESTDGTPIPSGTKVKVADVRGTRVVVSAHRTPSRRDETTR